MNDVISMLKDNKNFVEASIFLNLPGNGQGSDEDSDVENGCSANHLSHRQLTAPAEFTVKYGSENVNSLDNEVDSDAATDESVPDSAPESEVASDPPDEPSLSSCLPPVIDRTWVKKELPAKTFAGEPTEHRFTEPFSPVGIFIRGLTASRYSQLSDGMITEVFMWHRMQLGLSQQ